MPRTKSAKKQMRQARSRTARNRSQRSALRTTLKQARTSAESKPEAIRLLDRAARKRLIHPNKAARLKSHLAKAAK